MHLSIIVVYLLMEVRDRNKMNIWFGITLGSLICMVLLTILFGNGKEVASVIPVTLVSSSLYEYYSTAV